MYLVHRLLRNLGIVCMLLERVVGYTPIPRWGAGVAIVNDVLYVHGGKTDQFNMYSYTSAPASNDVLYLSLSYPFNLSLIPWQLVSGGTQSSTSQGPAVAWHTLSAFNTSGLLLFGGDLGPNSGTATGPDSAALLNIFGGTLLVWISEPASWANEPMRRIHHSASSTDGKIWIVGGEKDDGSGSALSDHYVFDPAGPTFTQLPSTNGPPDLFGHATIVLLDGRLLVFGGCSESMAGLIPFSTIWVLDTTQATPSWTLLPISSSSLPTPRRAFASVLLDGGKILIQGGADAALQNVYSDGWVLDTTQNPMVWSSVASLSQLGPRYDHFTVRIDSQVIFGFGYGSSGPVSSTFQIYDSSSDSFPSSFTPSTSTPPTNTLSISSQTHPATGTQTSPSISTPTGSAGTSQHGSGTDTGSHGISGTGTSTGVLPTSTVGVTSSGLSSKGKAAAIAVATSFGAMALVAGCVVVGIWYRSRRPYTSGGGRFHLLGGRASEDGDGDSEHMEGVIPTAGAQHEKFRSGPTTWFSAINKESRGHPELGRALSTAGMQRRDMFADEDTGEFGTFYNAGRDGSWDLKSVGAAALDGVRGILTRENSNARSVAKEVSDPFTDISIVPYGVALVKPEARREMSSASTAYSYHDPFADHPNEEAEEGMADESTRLNQPHPSPRISLPPLSTLPPLTEVTSRSTELTGSSSHDVRASPFESHPSSSVTSYEYRPVHSSILNSAAGLNTLIRRSDSWWTRFSKTSFLDRKSSDGGKKLPSTLLDFRDPNPPPKLLPIQEGSTHSHSQSPASPEPQQARGQQAYSGSHRKSVSSLQTARTADSDAIERMGGMDIIQRVGTSHSHQTSPSTGRDTPDREQPWPTPRPLSVVASSGRSEGSHARLESNSTVDSPLEMNKADLGRSTPTREDPAPPETIHSVPHRPLSGGNVLNHIQTYERRISDVETASAVSPLSPGARNTRKREVNPSKSRVSIHYGFAPKPSLFVANPDHNGSPSSDS